MQVRTPKSQRLKHNTSELPFYTIDQANIIYNFPFNDLLFRAQSVHREHFDPNAVQMSRLLSIKPAGARKIAAIAANLLATRPA